MNENPKGLDRFNELPWNKNPYIPKLRPCLTRICENPHEAMLLDFFYTASHQNDEYMESKEFERYRVKVEQEWEESYRWNFVPLDHLIDMFCFLFDENQIYDTVLSLTKKGWVDFKLLNLSCTGGIGFYAHTAIIDQAILNHGKEKAIGPTETSLDIDEQYRRQLEKDIFSGLDLIGTHLDRAGQLLKEIREDKDAQWLEEFEVEKRASQIVKETEEEVQRNQREARKIAYHIGRDRVRGLIGTLTLTQWLETLDYFHWKCAYCPDGPYEVLEHFLPVALNGITTQVNCVPACGSCNRKKNSIHPSELRAKMGECIERVQQYLSQARFEHGERGR